MATTQETIDQILARETTGVSDLSAARDAAIKAVTDAYTEGMGYYKDLDITPEAWTRLSAAPIRKQIDTLYSNLVEANQRSRGTLSVRPAVDTAFAATIPLASQSVRDATTYGANLATKRADLLERKGSGVAKLGMDTATAIGNLRAGTTGQISSLRSDQNRLEWQGGENEKNRALERVKYASSVMPNSARDLYGEAGLGDPNLRRVLGFDSGSGGVKGGVVSGGDGGGGDTAWNNDVTRAHVAARNLENSSWYHGDAAGVSLANALRRNIRF